MVCYVSQERLAWLREHANDHEDDNAEGSAGTEDKQEEEAYKPPDVNPYDMDPAQRVRYEKFKNEQM